MGAGAIGVSVLAPNQAAAQVFDITVNTGGSSQTSTYTDFETFAGTLFSDNFTLDSVNPNYTNTSAATVLASFRGVPVQVVYPNAGASVVFNIPSLGFSQTFSAQGTRAGNEDDLLDFLAGNINNILTRVLQEAVATTPFDPVAGNPASLQAQMVGADFSLGSAVGPGNSFSASGSGDEDAPNLIGIGARLGRYTAEGEDVTVVDLPFSYVIPLSDPRYAVILDVPLTYVDTAGSASFAGSFGVGLRVPVLDNWTLTPAVRGGVTGSIDLGAIGALYSASVTSNVNFEVGGLDIDIGNMVSYVATAPLDVTVDDYTIDYDLTNFVTRNGVGVSGKLNRDLFGLPMTWDASVVNTQIFGDDVFVDNYTDVALSVGTEASQNGLTWDSIRLGLTYTFANEDYSGFKVNFGYQF